MAGGRKSIPDELKVLTGTFRPGRVNPNRPKPAVIHHEPPEHLSDVAKEFFVQNVEKFSRLGIITESDAAALEQIACVYGEWREADAILKAEGPFYETTTATGGFMKRPHPMLTARSDAARRLQTLMCEFGMTPASRNKVSAKSEEADAQDPAAKYNF